jgi:hypothetical protein
VAFSSGVTVVLPGNDVPEKPMLVKEYRDEIARKYVTETSYVEITFTPL